MYAWIFKTTLVFYFTIWVKFENAIYAKQRFRNFLGSNVILSQNPIEMFTFQNSFIECAMKCELSPGCEAFNLRTYNTSTGLKMCELFHYKETDIFNQIQVENGSTYYEKVSKLSLSVVFVSCSLFLSYYPLTKLSHSKFVI